MLKKQKEFRVHLVDLVIYFREKYSFIMVTVISYNTGFFLEVYILQVDATFVLKFWQNWAYLKNLKSFINR